MSKDSDSSRDMRKNSFYKILYVFADQYKAAKKGCSQKKNIKNQRLLTDNWVISVISIK